MRRPAEGWGTAKRNTGFAHQSLLERRPSEMSVLWPNPVRDSSVTNHRGSQARLAPAFCIEYLFCQSRCPRKASLLVWAHRLLLEALLTHSRIHSLC